MLRVGTCRTCLQFELWIDAHATCIEVQFVRLTRECQKSVEIELQVFLELNNFTESYWRNPSSSGSQPSFTFGILETYCEWELTVARNNGTNVRSILVTVDSDTCIERKSTVVHPTFVLFNVHESVGWPSTGGPVGRKRHGQAPTVDTKSYFTCQM